MGLGPARSQRRDVPGVLDERQPELQARAVSAEPAEAAFIGGLDLHTDVGYQNYRA
jgi:hypothetical protein